MTAMNGSNGQTWCTTQRRATVARGKDGDNYPWQAKVRKCHHFMPQQVIDHHAWSVESVAIDRRVKRCMSKWMRKESLNSLIKEKKKTLLDLGLE